MQNHSEVMIPLEEALRLVDEVAAENTLPRRKVGVRDAVGQTLATDQISRLSLPPFDKAAMDGYAVLAGDVRQTYRILETVAAGSVPSATLTAGTAVKVMTGAPIPMGTGQVIPIEHVRCQAGMIEVVQPTTARNLCTQSEDVCCGDVILRAGTRMSALDIANLISCGITEIEVFRPARLAILSTGDEIVDNPRDLRPGKIVNTNGPLLALLASQFHMDPISEQSLRDDRDATIAAISEAMGRADIVAISGGVSVGDFDFVGSALTDARLRVHFSAVAVKPGRPMTFAARPGTLVFGLPGNPVAVYLAFHLFILRAVAHMCGSPWPMRETTLMLASDFRRRKNDRAEYVPCSLGDDGALAPVDFHGSAHLTALTQADGFFVVPNGVSLLSAGARVRFLPLKRGW